MKKLVLIMSCALLFGSVAHANEKYQGKLNCEATLPLVFSSKTTVVLSPSTGTTRKVTVKKGVQSESKSYLAECRTQASILSCKWSKGKISIDTTLEHDPGFPVLNTNVGAYDYYNSKITLKRAFINKLLKFRCKI